MDDIHVFMYVTYILSDTANDLTSQPQPGIMVREKSSSIIYALKIRVSELLKL